MKWMPVAVLAALPALIAVAPAQAADQYPREAASYYRVPRFPWKANTYSSVQGSGIGDCNYVTDFHCNQDHYALDFGKIGIDDTGLPMLAVDNGTVYEEGCFSCSGYGWWVKMQHTQYDDPGLTSIYAHLNPVTISDGTAIKLGERVGKLGCTGLCFGPHLHFVIWSSLNCGSSACSVPWDGAGWDIGTRTGNPRLSTWGIGSINSLRSDHWYSDNACMGCMVDPNNPGNIPIDIAIKNRWLAIGPDLWSSHQGIQCAIPVVCTPSTPGYDPNYYYWCDRGSTTSACRWVHTFTIGPCQGIAQSLVENSGAKGLIARSTMAGCPMSAYSIDGAIFRGYVQWSDADPSRRVLSYMGFPIGQRYVPVGLPNYRVQDFAGGFMLLYIGPNYYDVEAWVNAGPRVFYERWPASDFP